MLNPNYRQPTNPNPVEYVWASPHAPLVFAGLLILAVLVLSLWFRYRIVTDEVKDG